MFDKKPLAQSSVDVNNVNQSDIDINHAEGDINQAGNDIVKGDKVDNSSEIDTKVYTEGNISDSKVAGENFYETHHHHYPKKKPTKPPKVDLSHLPKPSVPLIGREDELARLSAAFSNPQTRIATIIAAGGIGKSALTFAWLNRLADEGYHGVKRVFAWSFYSQGQHQTYTNSSAFFQTVFDWLGIKAKKIPSADYEKGRLLAQLVADKALLLVLDGLEPLQQAVAVGGFLQDSGIKEFLAQLQHQAQGFVLLSSRQAVLELQSWEARRFCCLSLETLKQAEGALLLESLQLKGSLQERLDLSRDLGGHALSLVLCGHLLCQFHDGDMRYAKELPPLYEISPSPSFPKRGTNSPLYQQRGLREILAKTKHSGCCRIMMVCWKRMNAGLYMR